MSRLTIRCLHATLSASSFAIIALALSLSLRAQQAQQPNAPAANSNISGISGYVLRAPGRTPISGAVVTVIREVPRDPSYQDVLPVQTGPDGSFNFSGLPDGSYSLVAKATGFFSSSYRFTISAASGVRNELHLILQQAGSISGTVYDEQNHPLRGVHVAVVCRNANGRVNGVIIPAPLTDDRGYFRATGLPASTCSVTPRLTSVDKSFASAVNDSPTPGSTQGIVVQAGVETSNVNLTLSTGSIASVVASQPQSEEQTGNASVSGHVLQMDTGAPISGAIVELFQTHPFPPRGTAPIDLIARTSPDGSYKFTSLPAGDFNVDVRNNGFVQQIGSLVGASRSTQSVSLASGQAVAGADVEMLPAGTIAGTIRDQDGKPIDGLSVIAMTRVSGTIRPAFRMAATATSDDEGNFRLSVPAPDEYYVGAGPLPFTPLSELGYHTVFYPNASLPEAGQPVSATVGGVSPELHFTVPHSQTYTVNVEIVGAEDNETNMYEIGMDRPGLGYDQLGPLGFHNGATSHDGTAQIRAVLPGSYTLTATPAKVIPSPDGPVHVTKQGPALAPVTVNVTSADVSVEIPANSQSAPVGAN